MRVWAKAQEHTTFSCCTPIWGPSLEALKGEEIHKGGRWEGPHTTCSAVPIQKIRMYQVEAITIVISYLELKSCFK